IIASCVINLGDFSSCWELPWAHPSPGGSPTDGP
ncbi:PRRT2 isoform 19, partial [Pan troglodytes]